MKNLLALVLVASLSGCGSIMNFEHFDSGPRVYGGVQIDASGDCWEENAIGIVDLPFSFVMDTALLPVYLVFALFR